MSIDPHIMFDIRVFFSVMYFAGELKQGQRWVYVSIIRPTLNTSATSSIYIRNFSNIHKQ